MIEIERGGGERGGRGIRERYYLNCLEENKLNELNLN